MPSVAARDDRGVNLRWPAWSIFVIPAAFVVVIGLSWRLQPVFFEWDGIFQVVAGREIWEGLGYHGWPSHFWPPLYSILAGMMAKVLPVYPGARLISLVSGGGLIIVTYYLTRLWFNDTAVALGAQFFTAANPLVVREALAAQNHMLEAFFFLACVTLLLRGMAEPRLSTFVFAGVVGALGDLSRYTSLILFPIGGAAILLALRSDKRTALLSTAAFLVAGGVVNLPWWVYNYLQTGSPLGNWHYVNTGLSMMRYVDPQVTEERWLYHDQEAYSSLSDLARAYPRAYLTNVRNTASEILSITYTLAKWLELLLPFGVACALLSRDQRTRRATWLVISLYLAWLLLASQALAKAYAMTVWAVVVTIVAVAALGALGRLITRWRMPMLTYAYWGAVAILAAFSLRSARVTVSIYGGPNHDLHGQLREAAPLQAAIRAHDPDLVRKTAMAANPAWGWNVGTGGFIEMPQYYKGTMRQLAVLDGLGPRVRRYVPRWPSLTPDSALRADYILYDSVARLNLPEIGRQLDAEVDSPDHGATVVFRSPSVTLYELKWPPRDSSGASR